MKRFDANGVVLQVTDYPSCDFSQWKDVARVYPLTAVNQAIALSTLLLVASRTYTILFWSPNRVSTLDFLGIEVTAAVAASSVDIAIYDGDNWLRRGAIGAAPRLYQTTGLATATTGVKSVNPALVLQPNRLYVATLVTSAHGITVRAATSVAAPTNAVSDVGARRTILAAENFASGVQGNPHTKDTSSLAGRPISTTLQADRTPFTLMTLTTTMGPGLFGRFAA